MAESRRIVLTGAGRGLGQAMAHHFATLGHTVIGCSQSPERVQELSSRLGKPHRFDVVNVASEPQVAQWAETVLSEGPPPDLVINNAAVINKSGPLWEVEVDDFDWVIDVNVKGVFYVLRHLLPAMVRQRKGVVVNFSSGWGRSTSPEVAPYCAAKFAIEGLTLALAQELPDGMCAVPLNPGIIHTDMLQSAFGSGAAAYPKPEQWAQRAVPFILGLGPRDNGRPVSVPS
jgi:NAD(P)-dependent dehydrogenase (short-subunit alcohol dehydrogenase family)